MSCIPHSAKRLLCDLQQDMQFALNHYVSNHKTETKILTSELHRLAILQCSGILKLRE